MIAAYLSVLRTHGADPAMRPAAVEAVVLLTSVLAVGGAYHHVLAEDDRVLVEGYYPEARALHAREAAELRAAWTFHARYVDVLTDPEAVEIEADLRLAADDGTAIPWSGLPEAGKVWARAVRLPDGSRVLHLIDLRSQSDDRWDAPRAPAVRNRGWTLAWEHLAQVIVASPWTAAGQMDRRSRSGSGHIRLPTFRRWLMIVGESDPPVPTGPPPR